MPTRIRLVAAGLLVTLAGCGERAGPLPTAANDLTPSAVRMPNRADDQKRLEQVARRLARALADPGFRLRLKHDLDHSRVREHKLHFQRFLTEGARAVAADIARLTGDAGDVVTAEALAAPALELYLPVPQHRARWSGGANVMVATALHDHEAPVAFDPSGRRQVLSPESPPATPVLALVPVETDFGAIEANAGASPTAIAPCPQGGARTGSVTAACGAGGGGSLSPGLWMTAASFGGTFEGWLKGDPEFEVHVLGQAGATDSLKDYQCAGEKQANPYWFDQNTTTWTGNVLVMSETQISSYKQQHPGQSFRVVVIEDDDTACQIKMDSDRFRTLINTIDTYYQRLTGGRDTTTGLARYWNRASAFQKILQSVWSVITTQDEFVGNAVQDAVATEYKAGYNWMVKGENNITNGALKLEMR
jgi:hypothetical protein